MSDEIIRASAGNVCYGYSFAALETYATTTRVAQTDPPQIQGRKQELESPPTAAFVGCNRIGRETASVAFCNVTSQILEQFIPSCAGFAHCK